MLATCVGYPFDPPAFSANADLGGNHTVIVLAVHATDRPEPPIAYNLFSALKNGHPIDLFPGARNGLFLEATLREFSSNAIEINYTEVKDKNGCFWVR